jgi:hypothetical protein
MAESSDTRFLNVCRRHRAAVPKRLPDIDIARRFLLVDY